MLNHITVQGRLTKDPELRTTQSALPVCFFTIACDTDFGEKHTDFINCIAWRQSAEFVSKYYRKGQMALVTGRLQSRQWEDKEGHKRVGWEIQTERVYFGESKRNDSQQQEYSGPQQFEPVDDDGDIPF